MSEVDEFQKKLFISEVIKQCEFALMAHEDMQIELEGMKRDNRDSTRFWHSVQGFLVASANISKMLYGTKCKDPKKDAKIRERAFKLRSHFGLKEDSCLSNRKLRNSFEHFDEKLDEFIDDNPKAIFVDSNIGPINSISAPGVIFYRHYDPMTSVISCLSYELNATDVISAIKEIRVKTSQEI